MYLKSSVYTLSLHSFVYDNACVYIQYISIYSLSSNTGICYNFLKCLLLSKSHEVRVVFPPPLSYPAVLKPLLLSSFKGNQGTSDTKSQCCPPLTHRTVCCHLQGQNTHPAASISAMCKKGQKLSDLYSPIKNNISLTSYFKLR